jgi:hypothetical protein
MKQALRLEASDRLPVIMIMALGVIIGGLILGGKECGSRCWIRTGPKVQHFSWADQEVGASDRAFVLTFDRPMDQASVEKNLVINPPLMGKTSWAGRRMAFTLLKPIPYGERYHVYLKDARERFRGENQAGSLMQPFVGQFQSRDRAFAYIGSQGEEQGRLIVYNLTEKRKLILTPPELVIVDFKFYPQGDRILFSAADRQQGMAGLRDLQLYVVPTGMGIQAKESNNLAGFKAQVSLVLDNIDYQNNQFSLSPDGETIVVQRVNRRNPADFDLWVVRQGDPPQPLKVQGGDFLITPDSQNLAVARGEGISLLPLQPGAKPLDFLPKFGQLLSFAPDGTAAAMVDFNTQDASRRYLRSLFYVNNQGIQKELLTLSGSIRSCQFNAIGTALYCLLTQLEAGENYHEKPYFAKIDLKAGKAYSLAKLPEIQDITMSLAPDDLGILFDQVLTTDNALAANGMTTDSGATIIGSRIWLLIPPSLDNPQSQSEVTPLPLMGYRPQWMP